MIRTKKDAGFLITSEKCDAFMGMLGEQIPFTTIRINSTPKVEKGIVWERNAQEPIPDIIFELETHAEYPPHCAQHSNRERFKEYAQRIRNGLNTLVGEFGAKTLPDADSDFIRSKYPRRDLFSSIAEKPIPNRLSKQTKLGAFQIKIDANTYERILKAFEQDPEAVKDKFLEGMGRETSQGRSFV